MQVRCAGNSKIFVLVAVCVAAVAAIFVLSTRRSVQSDTDLQPSTDASVKTVPAPAKQQGGIVVFCAAGMKQPVEKIAKEFEGDQKVEVALQYGGTATLLSQLKLAKTGDVFIAADRSSLEDARKAGVIQEVIPLAKQRPVIAVRKGNPLGVKKLEDLYRADLKVAIANPEAASIGKLTKKAFGADWERFSKKVTVMKPTVTEIAADLAINAVDAAILWDATVHQFKNIEAVEVPELTAFEDVVSAAVLTSSTQPTRALAFARYLAAPEKGGAVFKKSGFTNIPGDAWAPEPGLTIYSGGVNRLSIEKLLNTFAEREGAKLTTVFNGCGVLCATIKSMEKDGTAIPDVYFACDMVYVPPVAHHFPDVEKITETEIVILVKKGNPHGIKTVADLAKKGLRVGLCNVKQSTLGYLTDGILRSSSAYDAIRKNVIVEVPTADFLVNQMRVDGLDATIVYGVNAAPQAENLDVIPIDHPGNKAVQPIGIGAQSQRKQLAGRLVEFFKAHRADFEKAGFVWHSDNKPVKSAGIVIPDWLKASQ